MKMKALLLRAYFGYGKRKGQPWILLSYACGTYEKQADGWHPDPANNKSVPYHEWRDYFGLELAHSFVPVKHQEDVKNFLRELEEGDFPHLVYLETSINNQNQVEVIGISNCQDPDCRMPIASKE